MSWTTIVYWHAPMSEAEDQSDRPLRPISMEATQRIIEAAGASFPRGVRNKEQRDQHIRKIHSALNFVVQYVAISNTWFDAQAAQNTLRRELRTLDEDYNALMAPSDGKPTSSTEEELALKREGLVRSIEALEGRKMPRPPYRPKELSTHLYPWLLGLYDLGLPLQQTFVTPHTDRSYEAGAPEDFRQLSSRNLV